MAEDAKTDEAVEPGTAEAPVTPGTPVEPETPVAQEAEDPLGGDEALTLAEVQGWQGSRLDDMRGSTVGKITGIYVDADSGNPEWLLARMGRFGHHCLVPARDAVAAGGHVWVPYARNQIRKAPRIDAGKPLERERETALLEHYGVGTGQVGRGADLAEREPSAVTARPA